MRREKKKDRTERRIWGGAVLGNPKSREAILISPTTKGRRRGRSGGGGGVEGGKKKYFYRSGEKRGTAMTRSYTGTLQRRDRTGYKSA